MKIKSIIKITTAILITSFAQTVTAQDLSVNEIMQKYDTNAVYETGHMNATMKTTDTIGSSKNTFESYSKKNGDTLIVITEGADSGQKILRLQNSVYLYYPDAEEVIRLQGSALKESIMGSDFTYEDLTGDNSTLSNYNAQLLGLEKVDDADCYHVKLTAKSKKQLYQIEEIWIDTQMFASRKVIVYSASGKALSENRTTDFKQVSGKWIGTKSTMQNLLKKSSKTEMLISNVEINCPIPEKYFSQDELSW